MDHFEYFPCVRISNQAYFNPFLYDKQRDAIEPIRYIVFQCEACNNTFCNRDLHVQKNKYKILCQDCGFTNNTFKIRSWKNRDGDKILYQSQLELKFIKALNQRGILVNNGPHIPYQFMGKTHKYKVDFYLPQASILVECKDNHHWHKKNCETGKWQAKSTAAAQYAKDNNCQFEVVFPKNLMAFIDKLVNKI
jgi:hypothetical protein